MPNSDDRAEALAKLLQKREELVQIVRDIDQQISDLGVDANLSTERGAQKEMADTMQVTRETVRRYGRTYFRSIIHHEGTAAYIFAPSDESLRSDVVYEIRDTDKKTVLGFASGRDLIQARKEQRQAYLTQDPNRTNIALVNVQEFIQGSNSGEDTSTAD